MEGALVMSVSARRAAHAAEVISEHHIGFQPPQTQAHPLPYMLFHIGLRSMNGRSVPWDLEGENDVEGTERRAGTEWGQMRSTIGKGLVFVVDYRHLHQLEPEKAWNADR